MRRGKDPRACAVGAQPLLAQRAQAKFVARDTLGPGDVQQAAASMPREFDQGLSCRSNIERRAPFVLEQRRNFAARDRGMEAVRRAQCAAMGRTDEQREPHDQCTPIAASNGGLGFELGVAVSGKWRGRVVFIEAGTRRLRRAEDQIGRDVHEAHAAGRAAARKFPRRLHVDDPRQPGIALAIGDACKRGSMDHGHGCGRVENALEFAHVGEIRLKDKRACGQRQRQWRAVNQRDDLPTGPARRLDHVRAEKAARTADQETPSLFHGALIVRFRRTEPYDSQFAMSAPTQAQSAFKSVLVIANPISGAGRGAGIAKALARELEAAGLRVEVRLTAGRGDATNFAAQAQADAVVSVGGDGTLNEVLRGLRDPLTPVGVVPIGTANVLALDLGLSADPSRAARTILGGHSVKLDTAVVHGELSFLVVGVGFDAEAVRCVEQGRRGPISKLSYVKAGLKTLWNHREPKLAVEIDGERLPESFGWVLVSNVIHYGGLFRLASDRELDDGLWEVYLFERAARRHLLVHGIRALLGRLPAKGASRRRARRVRITSAEPVAAQADGDSRGQTPIEIDVRGPQFRILCPE